MSRRHRTPKDFEESTTVVKSKKLHGDVVIDNIVDIVCDGKKFKCRILGLSDDPAELIALDEQFWKNGGLDGKSDTSELQSTEKLVDQTGDMEDDVDEPPQPPPKRPRKGAESIQTSNPDDSIQEFVDQTIGTLLDNTAVYPRSDCKCNQLEVIVARQQKFCEELIVRQETMYMEMIARQEK
ncbi:uncharacterized protein LOC117121223 [Anneissia japonica]|uniref:uncharacterized protein LOC117121223 n=1 Tax=Anneissia japonica TaxID=1529436 RepID=UPI00142560E6|nr:uncharacterized protein LOC117121223 [Anneissia japonica]